MAKIKTEAKKPVENITDETIKTSETVVESESTDETKTKTEKQDEEDLNNTPDTNVVQELPDNIQRILKIYRNMPELYINKFGGVFTVDTKPSIRGNAVLYKNPFYKSNK